MRSGLFAGSKRKENLFPAGAEPIYEQGGEEQEKETGREQEQCGREEVAQKIANDTQQNEESPWDHHGQEGAESLLDGDNLTVPVQIGMIKVCKEPKQGTEKDEEKGDDANEQRGKRRQLHHKGEDQ